MSPINLINNYLIMDQFSPPFSSPRRSCVAIVYKNYANSQSFLFFLRLSPVRNLVLFQKPSRGLKSLKMSTQRRLVKFLIYVENKITYFFAEFNEDGRVGLDWTNLKQ